MNYYACIIPSRCSKCWKHCTVLASSMVISNLTTYLFATSGNHTIAVMCPFSSGICLLGNKHARCIFFFSSINCSNSKFPNITPVLLDHCCYSCSQRCLGHILVLVFLGWRLVMTPQPQTYEMSTSRSDARLELFVHEKSLKLIIAPFACCKFCWIGGLTIF